MITIFNNSTFDKSKMICHSGGAEGSDTYWEVIGQKWGVITKAYSYKTKSHKSPNKVEITDSDYNEGILRVEDANKILCRTGISKYMNLLARNWAQVKYSDEVFAIGTFINVGEKNSKGYLNKGKLQIVDGGTGYATTMAILSQKPVFLFDQLRLKWYKWSFSIDKFVELGETPKINCENFAGIGTRQLSSDGKLAIEDVYNKTFNIK
jgi:hypothetical protein